MLVRDYNMEGYDNNLTLFKLHKTITAKNTTKEDIMAILDKLPKSNNTGNTDFKYHEEGKYYDNDYKSEIEAFNTMNVNPNEVMNLLLNGSPSINIGDNIPEKVA